MSWSLMVRALLVVAAVSYAFAAAAEEGGADQTKGQLAEVTYASIVVLPPASALDLEAEGLDLGSVAEALELQFRDAAPFEVLSSTELQGLADAADVQRKVGCFESSECMARVTADLGSDLVLATDLARIDATLLLNIRVVQVDGARVLARQTLRGADTGALKAALPAAVEALLEGLQGKGKVLHITLEALGDAPSFAVMDLKPQNVSALTAESLTDALAVEFSQFQGARVFSRKDMAAMLTLEAQKQTMGGCDDMNCVIEIGGALGVRFIVTGAVSRLADRFFVSVRIIDATKARVIATDAESFMGPEDELLVGMRFLVRRLFQVPYEGSGRLRLSVAEAEAALSLDGKGVGVSPNLALPETVVAGKHLLEVQKEGFFPLVRETYVEPARVTSLALELKALPTPWYKTWWFWTLAGSLVAGTTATVVILGSEGDPTSGGGLVAEERP